MGRKLLLLLTFVFLALSGGQARATTSQDWFIQSFDATFNIRQDGAVEVTEDILVNFQDVALHGILRYIPVEYKYDENHNRLLTLSEISVDKGEAPVQFRTSRRGADLELRIGDPDRTVTGLQRYRIRYLATGALNAFDDHDEFYWNVTGDRWEIPIRSATASVQAPAISQSACFEGPTGFDTPCAQVTSGGRPLFQTRGETGQGSGLTIVIGTPKGAVQVPPPQLIRLKTAWEQVRDFLGLKPLPVVAAVLAGIGGIGLVARQWWQAGRDRWFGDAAFLSDGNREITRPLFAHETIVPEFAPPEVGKERRRLRPAEVGLVVDEDADTLDVSATIVDLAVRRYLRIEEVPKAWLFGKSDYRLVQLKSSDAGLLPYEQRLHNSLFEDGASVLLSDLKNEFYTHLSQVKKDLYVQGASANKFFPTRPDNVRNTYLVAGLVVAALGGGAIFLLGIIGAGIIGVPVIIAGLLLALLSPAMPRRTGLGRETMRRSLGFREFMVTAQTDHARFQEEANIFSEYLPYAIVFGCTKKWAEAFEDLELSEEVRSWYSGSGAFYPVVFASSVNSFSESLSTAIASTPSSSGGSGFSGGSSGGGMGGGGGGGW